MTTGEIAQIMTAGAALIGALTGMAGLVIGLMNRAKVEVIHRATNSLVDQLVQSTAKASEGEGRATGLAQGRAESAGLDPAQR